METPTQIYGLYGASSATWNHTVCVTCHPTQVNTLCHNPDKPVLDLPTPEGWRAEFRLSWYNMLPKTLKVYTL